MSELIGIEYREDDWADVEALQERVGAVADALVDAEVALVGVAGLLAGEVEPLSDGDRPAVWFGLRARTPQVVACVGEQLSRRGYSGIFTRTDEAGWPVEQTELFAGHGMVFAPGGDCGLYGASLAEIRRALRRQSKLVPTSWPAMRMPGVDELDRGVDGLYLDEAEGMGVDLVWIAGSGVNRPPFGDRDGLRVVTGRRDTGGVDAVQLAKWARGDRVDRAALRLRRFAQRPGRWLRKWTGLR